MKYKIPPKPVCLEQSPNWDKRSDLKLYRGRMIPGFPFNEGFPYYKFDTFEIILRDGTRLDARLDLSTQHRAEGMQWKSRQGTHNKSVVACWRTKPPLVKKDFWNKGETP